MKAFRPLLPFLSDKKTILFWRGKTRRARLFSGAASLKSKIYLSINYARNPTSRGLRTDLEFLCSNALQQKAIKDYQSSWLLGSQLNAKQSIGLVQSLRLIYSQSTSRIPIPFPPMRLFASIPR